MTSIKDIKDFWTEGLSKKALDLPYDECTIICEAEEMPRGAKYLYPKLTGDVYYERERTEGSKSFYAECMALYSFQALRFGYDWYVFQCDRHLTDGKLVLEKKFIKKYRTEDIKVYPYAPCACFCFMTKRKEIDEYFSYISGVQGWMIKNPVYAGTWAAELLKAEDIRKPIEEYAASYRQKIKKTEI